MSREGADAATVARLQALLAPESGAPRIPAAGPRELRPLARILGRVAGRVPRTRPPNKSETGRPIAFPIRSKHAVSYAE